MIELENSRAVAGELELEKLESHGRAREVGGESGESGEAVAGER